MPVATQLATSVSGTGPRRKGITPNMPSAHNPLSLGAGCSECPYAKNGKPVQPVMSEGPANPIGVLVGESPGREEVERGRPFVGKTGEALDEELRLAGIDRSKLLVINAICCKPKEPKKENEMREAVNCCRPAFLAQIAHLNPATIHWLVMGKWAGFAVTGKDKKLIGGRGFIRPLEKVYAPK